MDKQTFCWILECALLHFDGVSEQQMVKEHGINPKIARIGVKLCDYIKNSKIR